MASLRTQPKYHWSLKSRNSDTNCSFFIKKKNKDEEKQKDTAEIKQTRTTIIH